MQTKLTAVIMTALFAGLPAMVGCDREVSSETKVKDGPGGTKVEQKKTVEKADGTRETTTEKKTVDK